VEEEKSWWLSGIGRYLSLMKSAYEIAMERLNRTAPSVKLSDAQKRELAELDSQYAAKIAAREIALKGEIAAAADDLEKESALREQLATDRKKLQAELEDKKEAIRQSK
jgi:hypothetical protein